MLPALLATALLVVTVLVTAATSSFAQNPGGGAVNPTESGLPLSGGTMTGVINMDAYHIYSTTGPLELGGNCTVGGTGDVCASGALDVAGATNTTQVTFDGGGSVNQQFHAIAHANGGFINSTAAGLMRVSTALHAGAAASGAINIYTGNQSNAGNYGSGTVTVYSGDTTTDGDTGDVILRTGVAGAGAADAGDIKLQTHGTVNGITVLGATGAVHIFNLPIADLGVGSCTLGQISWDSGGATKELCLCDATNNWECFTPTTTNGPAD